MQTHHAFPDRDLDENSLPPLQVEAVARTRSCPKCAWPCRTDAVSCPRCRLHFASFVMAAQSRALEKPRFTAGPPESAPRARNPAARNPLGDWAIGLTVLALLAVLARAIMG